MHCAWIVLLAVTLTTPERVTFKSEDGVSLVADVYAAGKPKAPGVILLPMYGDSRNSWKRLAPILQEVGFTVLALDPRGHGESLHQADRVLDYSSARQGGENLFLLMHRDVAAATKHLVEKAGVDPGRVSLLGASIGCSVALDHAGRDPSVKAMVLLSPGKNYQGMDSVSHAGKLGRVPILIFTNGREKTHAEDIAGALPEGTVELTVHEDAPHGTRMLGQVEGIEARIAEFLRKNG
jgi:pimeloyl-ACP methyl ester carboxylesterase